jgi:2-methylcitrate dehydratase PrpD
MNDPDRTTEAFAATARVADFVQRTRLEDIPRSVLSRATTAILDSLGVALAGARSAGSEIIRRHIGETACAGQAVVFGTGLRTAPRFAALANGAAMHADDFDDTFHLGRVHPSAPVVSALMADAAREDCSGRRLVAAFSVGVEVTTKLSQAIDGAHYQRGYHATGTCGVFGAAAGTCNVRGAATGVILSALGIAASSAAGLRENFGTMTKPLHAGRAAESGWVAASLAALGFSASPTALEGARGFFAAGGGGYDPSILLRLGSPWSFEDPGIGIKPFPSGALTHPAMSKMRDLVIEHDIRPEQVARVRVRTNRLLPENLTYQRPATGLEGKFSMEFCLACILVLRRAGLAEFTDEVAARADIRDAIAKFEYTTYPDEEAKNSRYGRLTTFIDIVMRDGRTISGRADDAKGSPADPMTEDDVAAKFRECAAFAGWPAERSARIIGDVLELEKVGSVRRLAELLSQPE